MKLLKKLGITILIIIIVFVVLYALPKAQYDQTNIWLKENNDNKVLVMAHAGGKGLYPDNIRNAFDYSYNLGEMS